ncbi:MAG: hypothetical protein ACFCBW_16655 [Candidatus Competibacterales bacterium]
MGDFMHTSFDDSATTRRSAARLGVSEYELFALAHRYWYGVDAPGNTLERAFGIYLSRGTTPPWVRAFARFVAKESQLHRLDPKALGISAPAAPRNGVWIGLAALLGMAGIVGLLIYLNAQAVPPGLRGCALPPCYLHYPPHPPASTQLPPPAP